MKKRLSLRGRMVMTAVVAAGVALAVLLLLVGPTRSTAGPGTRPSPSLTAEARLMARVVEEQLGRSARARRPSTPSWTRPPARWTRGSR